MYVEKTDTYTCDFCGHNAKWDASDDVHGELWSCELHPPERHVSEWDADGNRPLR